MMRTMGNGQMLNGIRLQDSNVHTPQLSNAGNTGALGDGLGNRKQIGIKIRPMTAAAGGAKKRGLGPGSNKSR